MEVVYVKYSKYPIILASKSGGCFSERNVNDWQGEALV